MERYGVSEGVLLPVGILAVFIGWWQGFSGSMLAGWCLGSGGRVSFLPLATLDLCFGAAYLSRRGVWPPDFEHGRFLKVVGAGCVLCTCCLH